MINPSCCSDKIPESKISDKVIAALIFLFAFIIRLVYLNQVKDNAFFDITNLGLDPFIYDSWASDIAKGNWIGTEVFKAMPLYPYFLGGIYSIFGRNIFFVKILQALLGSFSCVLVYLIAQRFFNKTVGLLASVIIIFYGLFLFYEGIIIGTSLIIFLNLLAVFLLSPANCKFSIRRFFLAGVIVGLSALARGSALIFAVFIFAWSFFLEKPKRKNLLYGSFFMAGLLMIILPVAARNYFVGKEPVLITSHGGLNFFIGNNPNSHGGSRIPSYLDSDAEGLLRSSKRFAEKQLGRKELSPAEVSRFWYAKSLKFIKTEPYKYLGLLLRKFALFWNAREICDIQNYYFFIDKFPTILNLLPLSFGIVASIALLGIVISFGQRKKNLLLYLFILANLLSLLLFFITSRYRLVVVPVLAIFAAHAIKWLAENIRKRNFKTVLYSFSLLSLFFFVINLPNQTANSLSSFADSHYNLGVAYMSKGYYNKAEQEYRKAIEIDSRHAKAYNNLGQVYEKEGMYDRAVNAYKKAISANPSYNRACNNLGAFYEYKGMNNEAVDVYEKSLGIDQDQPLISYHLALCYMNLGKYEQAIKNFKKAIDGDFLDPRPHYYLGIVYQKEGNVNEAIMEWEVSLKLDPGNEQLKKNICILLSENKKK